jgi:nicotinamidase-related amidase
MNKHELPIPDHFNPKNAIWNYRVNQRDIFLAAQAWKAANSIAVSAKDRIKIALMLIDVQKDFCFPEGTLYVAGRSGTGAVDDCVRTSEFIYRNLGLITDITMTMDTHFPFQIFFPSFWLDENNQAPAPSITMIATADVLSGKYKPNPAVAAWLVNGNYNWLLQYAEHYCRTLEAGGKYTLLLWPEHCILGDEGHVLAGIVHEARMFHAYARNIQAEVEVKGGNPLTENYSIFKPEVLVAQDGRAIAQKNARFVKRLLEHDYVIIGGQAASHCVKSSIDDFLDEIMKQDPALAKKVYILRDCMSAVVIPPAGLDFTPQAEEALDRYRDYGMNVVESTTPIEDWPGMVV